MVICIQIELLIHEGRTRTETQTFKFFEKTSKRSMAFYQHAVIVISHQFVDYIIPISTNVTSSLCRQIVSTLLISLHAFSYFFFISLLPMELYLHFNNSRWRKTKIFPPRKIKFKLLKLVLIICCNIGPIPFQRNFYYFLHNFPL